jgi:thymidylate synthase
MAKIDIAYHKLLQEIKQKGFKYEDPNRKNVYRYQIPNYQIQHNFSDGFPAITTKKLYWKGVVTELLWFLRGDTNIKYLADNGINIWNKDAYNHFLKSKPTLTKCNSPDDCKEILFDKDNKTHYDLWLGNIKQGNKEILQSSNLGRVYGAQWRNWHDNFIPAIEAYPGEHKTVDQISNLIKGLKETPMGTKHIVTAWNPAELDNMALPPCHWSFEILVEPTKDTQQGQSFSGGILDFSENPSFTKTWEKPKYQFTLKWHQRSVDTFLGQM